MSTPCKMNYTNSSKRKKYEGWSRDGRVKQYTNKICRDHRIHYTSLYLLFLVTLCIGYKSNQQWSNYSKLTVRSHWYQWQGTFSSTCKSRTLKGQVDINRCMTIEKSKCRDVYSGYDYPCYPYVILQFSISFVLLVISLQGSKNLMVHENFISMILKPCYKKPTTLYTRYDKK